MVSVWLLSSRILLSYGNAESHDGELLISLPLPPFHLVAIWFASHCLPSLEGWLVLSSLFCFFLKVWKKNAGPSLTRTSADLAAPERIVLHPGVLL